MNNTLRLHYIVQDPKYSVAENRRNFEKMKQALEDVGFFINLNDGELYISLYDEKYKRVKNRNAGRKNSHVRNPEVEHYEFYRYSDIVFMMQTMTSKQISEKIQMPIATFNRHKKKLLQSTYYTQLDKTKFNDIDYLKTQPLDFGF